MNTYQGQSARVNVTLLLLLGSVAMLLAAGVLIGHKVRKNMMAQQALVDGKAAYQSQDWQTARVMLGRWLSAHPDDQEILHLYAKAQLSVHPQPPENTIQAMNAYRRLLRLNPADQVAFERLTLLYDTTGSVSELAYIAQKRLEAMPDDVPAAFIYAKALYYQQKTEATRLALEELVDRLADDSSKPPEFVEACILLSGLEIETDASDGPQRALVWLNRAVEYSPQPAWALVHRAALQRHIAKNSAGEDAHVNLAAARADLEKAEALSTNDPRVTLMLAEEWLGQHDFKRAMAQLEAAERVDPQVLRDFSVDPDDWSAARYVLTGKILLLVNKPEEGIKLAEEALDRFSETRQRIRLLPLAVELFVAANQVAQARRTLEEYLDTLKLLKAMPVGDDQLAPLKALVARAEGKPYEVIRLLEPIVGRPDAASLVGSLLADAYNRTGQSRRIVKMFSERASTGLLSAESAKLLGRAYLKQGDWIAAGKLLHSLEQIFADNLEIRMLRLWAEFNLACEGPSSSDAALGTLKEELISLREIHSQRADIRVLLAAIAEHRGLLKEAEAELKQAIAECEQPLSAMLPLAALYSSDGRLTESYEVLESACQQHGTKAAPWLSLSELLLGEGRIDEARTRLKLGLEKVTEIDEHRQLALRSVLINISQADRETGISGLRELAANDSDNVQVRALLLALPEVTQDEAITTRLLNEIKQIEGDGGLQWRIHQARLWLTGGQWRDRQNEIEELLKYCIDADPRWSAPILLLGQMYEELGNLNDAELVYKNGFKLSESTQVADRLMTILQRQGRGLEVADLLDSMQEKLDRRALGTRRVQVAMGAGQYGQAINALEELLVTGDQRNPMDLVVLARLVYLEQRDVDGALEYLRQAAEIAPDLLAVVSTRVLILKQEKRYDEAAAVLDELVNTKQTPAAYLLRALYRLNIGQPDLAEQDYLELAQIATDASGYGLLGGFYAGTERLDKTIETWREGLKKFPGTPELERDLAKALLIRNRTGDREQAHQLLDELEQHSPNDTELLWIRALEILDSGMPDGVNQVRELLRRATGTPLATADTYRGLAGLALRLQDFKTARELVRRGLLSNPGDSDLLLLQAQTELGIGNLDLAREIIRSVLASDQKNIGAYEALLEVAVRQEDQDALNGILTAVVDLVRDEPAREDLQLLRARIHLALGQNQAALAGLDEFHNLEAGQQSVPVLLLISELHRIMGKLNTAEQYLNTAASLAPDDPGVLHSRMLMAGVRQQYDEVIKLTNEVKDTNQQPKFFRLAATILAKSPVHLDTAITFCQQATQVAPHDVSGYVDLGMLTYQKGDAGRAEQAYRAVLERDSEHAEALNNLAWVLAEKPAGCEEALSYAQRAVALQPDNANFRNTLGFILTKLPGRLEAAREEYRLSVRLARPGSALQAKSYLRLAQVCHQLGDLSPIPSYLTKALAVDQNESVFSSAERTEIEHLLRVTKKQE